MGEFRIGRMRAYATYPDPKFTGLVGPFARNYAAGPGPDVNAAPGGTTISWLALGVGVPGTDIPITPKSNGQIIIQGIMGLHNVGVAAQDVTVQVLVDGVALAIPPLDISIPAASFAELPILAGSLALVVGATANVSIVVTGDNSVNIVATGTFVEINEVHQPTG